MISLGPVAIEREKKLKSLLTDQTEIEIGLFWSQLEPFEVGASTRQRIEQVLRFALKQDYGPRDLDRYYPVHPIRVARFLSLSKAQEPAKPGLPSFIEPLVACLIHNTMEKEILTFKELERDHGSWIAQAIRALTVDRDAMTTEAGKRRYYEMLRRSGAEVEKLKFLDKFDNLFALSLNPHDQARESYLVEIETYIRPIGERTLPGWIPYLDELIASARKTGYYRPAFS